jgi:hypothetical protein
MSTRFKALLNETIPKPRRQALLVMGKTAGTDRRRALLNQIGRVTPFTNSKKRPFILTKRGSYVVFSAAGKRLYGRKALYLHGQKVANKTRIPMKIRPKRS